MIDRVLFSGVLLPELVIDAKYKTSVASANLQQMVSYCFATGARVAVLVFPAGFVPPRTVYRIEAPAPGAAPVEILTTELVTAERSVAGWRSAARQMVADVIAWASEREYSNPARGPAGLSY